MKAEVMRDFARRSDARQFMLFIGAGGTATVVQYCVLVILVEVAQANPTVGTVSAYICGAITSYLLNFSFTFRHSGTDFRRGFARFLIVNVIGLGLNTLIFMILHNLGAYYLAAQAVATILVLIWNYLGARLFVFRNETRAGASSYAEAE
jgi:putative flippase GtrA